MTLKRIKRLCAEGKMYLHHEASKKGYVSVKNGRSVAEYKGRFGNGFVVSLPNISSPQKEEEPNLPRHSWTEEVT